MFPPRVKLWGEGKESKRSMWELTHKDAYKSKEKSVFADGITSGVQLCDREFNFGIAVKILSLHWHSFMSEILKVELNVEFMDNLIFFISQNKQACSIVCL